MNIVTKIIVLLVIVFVGCTPQPNVTEPSPRPAQPSLQEATPLPDSIIADVLNLKVKGEANAYQFEVEVLSPDTGCDQYADWWEVLSVDGELLYRRVLSHSHVDEQPFTRSGGSVPITEDRIVIVRAHMNTGGYGGRALTGSIIGGFQPVELEAGFAAEVEALDPLPADCAF